MVYRITFLPKALRQLARVPRPDQVRIARRIDLLSADPRPPGSTKLRGSTSFYRIRSGEYRIIYDIRDEELVILVITIGHRRDVYRGL